MTPSQELVIESMARATSAISLAGCLFILITFGCFTTFRKPINRLIVYASIGNILTNSATIISVTAIPSRGASLALCRFQGFFIQMFMPADSLWTLCMALNVYLTFFKNYNAVDLRGLELRYFLACYGICFIPALVYLILDQSRLNTGIYGDAVLWCWVAKDWEWMRISFFYGPVWCVIIVTIAIYCVTGRVIFKQRRALRAFSRSNEQALPQIQNPFTAPNVVTAVTEVVVTSESIRSDDTLKPSSLDGGSRSSFSSTHKLSGMAANQSSNHHGHSNSIDRNPFPRYEPDNAVWPYSNAVSGARGNTKNVFSTSVSAGGPLPAELLLDFEGPRPGSSAGGGRKSGSNGRHANDAAWGYAKVAFLMFVALFIVWVPSTVNRVYALAHPQEINFALNLVAAAVLPLQGFWNFVIYVSTTWTQCKDAWQDVRDTVFGSLFPRKAASSPRSAQGEMKMTGALRPQSSRGGPHAADFAAGLHAERKQRSGSSNGKMSLTEALDMDNLDSMERGDTEDKDDRLSSWGSRPATSERRLTGR